MKKKSLCFLALFSVFIYTMNSQEVCETPEEKTFLDLNSITKCSIKPSKNKKDKNDRQISVKVSASKSRYLKRREIKKKLAVSNSSSINSQGLNTVSSETTLHNEMKFDISSLTNSLSEEQVRLAERFNTIDQLPSFNKCKIGKKSKMYDCFNEQMIKHIEENFRYPSEAIRNMTQGEVWIRFIIDTNGNVTNVKALGPENGEILKQEALRVVSKLKKFKPGKKDGKLVPVKYGFPINFALED